MCSVAIQPCPAHHRDAHYGHRECTEKNHGGGLKMNTKRLPPGHSQKLARCLAVLTCAAILLPGNSLLFARSAPPLRVVDDQAVKIPPDQLDSLVAPIALYPDNLLSQTLVASTYPLEIIQLEQWLEKNPDLLKDQKKL